MSTYKVSIPEVHYVVINVIADSEEEALDKATGFYAEGLEDIELTFSHALDRKDWKAVRK